MVSHGDALVEGLHDGKVHDASEVGLGGEDEDEGVVGVHAEVGEETKLLEGAGLEEMRLVDDEEDGLSGLLFGLQDGSLDLLVDGALAHSLLQADQAVDVVEEVGAAEGGKRRIERLEEVFIEGVDEAAEGDGLSHAGLAGEEKDAASALDVVEPGRALLEGRGVEYIAGLDVLVKGEALETKPGEELIHERVLALWNERWVETF